MFWVAQNNLCLNFSDIDECISNPCKTNAECKDGINSYSCECKEGYSGNGTKFTGNNITDNQQLLGEFEHNIKNYQSQCLPYLPKLKAGEDNTNGGLDNSSYHAITQFYYCFIMHSMCIS